MSNSREHAPIFVQDENSDFEDKFFNFLELSQKIRTIVSHENAILEACGCLSLEAYLAQKTALLHAYELEASSLCRAVLNDQSQDEVSRSILTEEIQAVKNTLHDNTVKQFSVLEKSAAPIAEDISWH